MNFDLRPFEAECLVSDSEWQMILESGAYAKIGKWHRTVFKRHLLAFKMTECGNIELVKREKIPCENYKLPLLDNTMNFQQRLAVYKEEERIAKGRMLDDENFLIYGT